MSDERFMSYAQNLEDVLLWRALSGSVGEAGFYIDLGAADPTLLSVTRPFYDRGWRGINVEPLPEQAVRLRAARPRDVVVQAAVGAAPAEAVAFHRVTKDSQTGLSTTDAAEAEQHRAAGAAVDLIEVTVTTLAEVCRAHVRGPIHFLKIDVEGAEAATVAGADFAAYRPWIVLVEATQPLDEAASDLGWEPGLLAAGYEFVWFDGLNRFYLAREHQALARHFRVPPNVFDRYEVYDAPLREHLAETIALSHRRGEMIERLEAELANVQARLQRERAAEPPAAPKPVPIPEPVPRPVPEPALVVEARRMIDLPFSGTGLGRRIGLRLYGLIRPVVRPIAWRSRQFMIGTLREELAGLRIRLDQLVARPVNAGADAGAGAAMERALLTLAMQDAHDPAPPGLDPAESGLSNPRAAR